jgi:hypothetical protein
MKWVYAFLLFVLFSMPSAAHVSLTPSPGNNLSSAVIIPDPEKTYAIYGTLRNPGETDYYRLTLSANQMLELQLSVPDPSFMPTLVVMGPGIETRNVPPDSIKAPEGAGVTVFPGMRPESAWYEPFSPMSIYQVSNYSMPAGSPGSYYVAIYSQDQAGAYSLATGSLEEFSPSEWVMVPLDMIKVRLWQGQTLPLIFGPMIVVVIVGILILWSNKRRRSANAWLAAISGLTFLGTAATIAVQTAIALRSAPFSSGVLVTMILLIASLLLGIAAIILSTREWPVRARAAMLAIGLMGLVFWSGLVIGPILAFLAAVIPHNMKDSHRAIAKGKRQVGLR